MPPGPKSSWAPPGVSQEPQGDLGPQGLSLRGPPGVSQEPWGETEAIRA